MVAPLPARISKLRRRLHDANTRSKHLPPSSALRDANISPVLSTFRILPVTTRRHHAGVHLFIPPDDRLSDLPAYQLICLHRLGASLSSLCALFCIRFLCFQSFAASFPKTPGVGVSAASVPLCLCGKSAVFARPLFSYSYELLHSQPLCFHIDLRLGGLRTVFCQNHSVNSGMSEVLRMIAILVHSRFTSGIKLSSR